MATEPPETDVAADASWSVNGRSHGSATNLANGHAGYVDEAIITAGLVHYPAPINAYEPAGSD